MTSASDTGKTQEFQAEVRQLLDIVVHSLYTDKEIFVRELVSNAADALEKLRHTQLTEKEIFEGDSPLEIRITTDETARTVTIADSGIGMSREELVENLGTIAHSGSKQFMSALSESAQKESSLIGQFGVGFYSAFMVADRVQVYTHSWRNDEEHLVWESDGKTGYAIEEAPGQGRGTRIVVHLREDQEEFAKPDRVKGILESYSSFVPFPILLNGDRVNTIEALWLKNKADIDDEAYNEFYKFTAKAFDEPRYRMHFSADAPLEINALLFVPLENTELWGFGQMDPGVSLYCKQVLIDDEPKGLLPEWLRFLRGVIDSSDLPLNISRESMQDSALVQKLNRVVTKRFLKFLDGESKKDRDQYVDFYKKFSRFLKEGVASDPEHKDALAKLLRFESSMHAAGELVSLSDYLSRMREDQKEIYYLVGESREAIEAGPYVEAFKARSLEVLYLYEAIDDYVISNVREFEEKTLVPADRAGIELEDLDADEKVGEALEPEKLDSLCTFVKETLGEGIEEVAAGKRLVDSPVAALSPDDGMSPQMRRMMQAMNPGEATPPVKVKLEINPRHPLVHRLAEQTEANPELAKLAIEQLHDQALLAAGLLDEKQALIKRGYALMERALGDAS